MDPTRGAIVQKSERVSRLRPDLENLVRAFTVLYVRLRYAGESGAQNVTRLRQLACDVRLVDPTYEGRSSKITRAEPGGYEGKGLWRPAALGFRPRYENDRMQQYLKGSYIKKSRKTT